MLEVDDPTRALHILTGWALDRGCILERLEVARPSLEDVYLTMISAVQPSVDESP